MLLEHEQRAREVMMSRDGNLDITFDDDVTALACALRDAEQRGLQRAAARLEARAASEQITAHRAGVEGAYWRRDRAAGAADVLYEEASLVRVLGDVARGEQLEPHFLLHIAGDEWLCPEGKTWRARFRDPGPPSGPWWELCRRCTEEEGGGNEGIMASPPAALIAAGWRRVSRGDRASSR